MNRQIVWGWILTGPALAGIIALHALYPAPGPELPRWYAPVCFYLFLYVLYMARILVTVMRAGKNPKN